MFKTLSGPAAIAFGVLFVLQMIPTVGIFFMIFGGAFLTGLLIHVVLLALAVESWTRRIPRSFIALPLIAYGSYFGLYAWQTIDIARASAEYRRSNSGKVLDFDAEVYSLVTPAAQTFVGSHKIAVAYEANSNFPPEDYLSFRVIRRDQCNIEKDSQNRIGTWVVPFGNTTARNLCSLRFPENPPHRIVSVVKTGDEEVWKRKNDIGEQKSEVSIDGKIIGTYKTASVWRLPLLPLIFAGCGLDSATPVWRCAVNVVNRSYVTLDTVPYGVDRERFDGPESVMLGIPKYSLAELADFQGYPQNEAALAWLAGEPKRVEDRMFAVLRELAEGGYPKVSPDIGFSVGRNPARLAPFVEAMANRLIELSNIRPSDGDGQEYSYRYEGLARALLAVPDDAFASVAAPLNAHFYDRVSDSALFMELRARIQRATPPQAPDFYEADFLTAKGYRRLFPTLAICRIGHASPAIVTEMRERILQGSVDTAFDMDNKTALIVTLLKLGQGAFIREHKSLFMTNAPARFEGWLDAVLSGKGATEIGPNNCMSMDSNGRRQTKPSLVWSNGVWYIPRS